jgi:hypothetical protein
MRKCRWVVMVVVVGGGGRGTVLSYIHACSTCSKAILNIEKLSVRGGHVGGAYAGGGCRLWLCLPPLLHTYNW